ncbi:telomere binding protein [Stygiomarasmius scandens]|uniref:Telomere binding protein n=1 Tax=Marasmiellus scandens TaxID=2682957 RepID=A0ABR1JVF6_9AGAR
MDIRQLVHDLQQPLPNLPALLARLSAPLDAIGLLPPRFRSHNVNPIPSTSVKISIHIPAIQKALVEQVLPTWDVILEENESIALADQYFCPDLFSSASLAAGQVALDAYSTLMTLPLNKHSLRLLCRLSKEYPIDRLHKSIFSGVDGAKKNLQWEDCVQVVVSVPAKVANYIAGNGEIPTPLEHKSYFNDLCIHCETLIWISRSSRGHVSSIAHLIHKLARLGIFPPAPPSSRSQPSFFEAVIPIMKTRFAQPESQFYSSIWWCIQRELSSITLQIIIRSLFAALKTPDSVLDGTHQTRALVKKEATFAYNLCSLSSDPQEVWDSVSAVVLGQNWTESYSRLFVCWLAMCETNLYAVLSLFLNDVVSLWSSPDHIKHSLLTRHRYVTSLLLLTVSYLPSSSITSLATSPQFISGVGTYIGHMDNSVRRCGMLAAEVVANRAGKQLDFKDWEGDDGGKPWARSLRKLLDTKDLDADIRTDEEILPEDNGTEDLPSHLNQGHESPKISKKVVLTSSKAGYDSDDSLTGYNSPPSSRSNSPTPSELEEIEKDPSLAVGVKKIERPVYLAQLGAMIRNKGGLATDNSNEEADKIEMALNTAEGLIRKKKDFGTELEENAVDIAYGLVALQDNYELDGFETKRQNALIALIACCPRKAAPCLIEEFFKNQYSTNQRYAILNALAVGARELASLPVQISSVLSGDVSFPSKRLPAPLHRKYITSNQILPQIMGEITQQALAHGQDAAIDKAPELVRERRLRVRQTGRISEFTPNPTAFQSSPKKTTFNEVAAEFFIGPLINRFWLFLRDERAHEERTAHYEGRNQYRGMGTGLILNPVVISHLLRTLAILMHASHSAPEWLAVLAPESLELAVTIGTRPLSLGENDDEERVQDEDEGEQGKEATVISSALELALVILDGCLELDDGRSLGLDHTALLMGTAEWAGAVFAQIEHGIKMRGGGGSQETTLLRAVSGVLLKADDIRTKWQRSMIDIWQ